LTESQIIGTYYIRNEFRPSPRWNVYSSLEWNDQETSLGSSILETGYWRLSEKLEAKIGFQTRLNLQYRQYFQDLDYDRITRYYETSTWIEHRWTPAFQNTLYGLFRYTEEDEGSIHDVTHYWEGRYDIVLRKNKFWGVRRLELVHSLLGSSSSTEGYNPQKYFLISSSSSLDLYPLHSTILRLQFVAARYLDELVSEDDYTSISFNMRLSLQF
jgi:hypothetical protein